MPELATDLQPTQADLRRATGTTVTTSNPRPNLPKRDFLKRLHQIHLGLAMRLDVLAPQRQVNLPHPHLNVGQRRCELG